MNINLVDIFSYCCFFGLFAIRGTLGLALKLGADIIPPASLVTIRAPIGMAIWFIWVCAIARNDEKLRSDLRAIWTLKNQLILFFTAFTLNAPFILFAYGLHIVPVGVFGIIQASMPLWAIMLKFVPFLKVGKPVTMQQIGGVVLGLAGVALILSQSLNEQKHLAGMSPTEAGMFYLMPLIGAVLWGLNLVYWERYGAPKFHPILSGLTNITFGFLIALVVAFSLEWDSPPLGFEPHWRWFSSVGKPLSLFAIFFLALGSGVAVIYCLMFLVKHKGALFASQSACFVPAVSLIEGILIEGEWDGVSALFKGLEILGLVLVILGLFVCNYVRKRPLAIPLMERNTSKEALLDKDPEGQ